MCQGGDCVKSVKYLVAVVAGTDKLFPLILLVSQKRHGDCKYKQNKAIHFCASDIICYFGIYSTYDSMTTFTQKLWPQYSAETSFCRIQIEITCHDVLIITCCW